MSTDHPGTAPAFRVVQPWGPDRGRQATLISEHHTAAEAFAEIDRLTAQMLRTNAGASSDSVELLVADADGEIIPPLRRHRQLGGASHAA